MSAGYSVLSKGAYNTGLSPVILCMYRDFTVTLMLLAVTWYFDGKPAIDTKHLPRLMLCGVSGVFCTQFFYTFGIKLTGADVGSVMQLLVHFSSAFVSTVDMLLNSLTCFSDPHLHHCAVDDHGI
jgi:drug/metabolite transporter (DMT)-like permease